MNILSILSILLFFIWAGAALLSVDLSANIIEKQNISDPTTEQKWVQNSVT